jgi:hypothetical protein
MRQLTKTDKRVLRFLSKEHRRLKEERAERLLDMAKMRPRDYRVWGLYRLRRNTCSRMYHDMGLIFRLRHEIQKIMKEAKS